MARWKQSAVARGGSFLWLQQGRCMHAALVNVSYRYCDTQLGCSELDARGHQYAWEMDPIEFLKHGADAELSYQVYEAFKCLRICVIVVIIVPQHRQLMI